MTSTYGAIYGANLLLWDIDVCEYYQGVCARLLSGYEVGVLGIMFSLRTFTRSGVGKCWADLYCIANLDCVPYLQGNVLVSSS